MSTKPKPVSVGTLWEIPATKRITITRPDGTDVQVEPVDGHAQHVLNAPGEYVAGEHTITAK